jgi:drug/metabolite transporter (DMT)-like permease
MLKVPGDRLGRTRKWLPICGLLLLCLIWAVGWVRADFEPGVSGRWSLTPLMAQAVLLGLFAFAASLAAVVRRVRWPARDLGWKAALVGIGLFVVPAVLTSFAKERIGDGTRVALFSLTPLFAFLFEPYLGIGAGEAVENRGGFLTAMTSIAGTLLVFPVELPRSYGAAMVMVWVVGTAVSIAVANCAGVRVARQSASVLTFAIVASGSAGLVLGIVGLALRDQVGSVPFDAWAMPDLFALALLFWLMGRMSAVQMTTRFVIAPLMANLISLALIRPHVDIQSWTGLVMIAAGAGWMVIGPGESGRQSAITLRSS